MKPIGVFDHHQDLGDPKLAGDAVYGSTDQTYTLSGAGVNLGAAVDALIGTSRYAAACVHGDTLTSLEYRATDGETTAQVELSSFHPTDIQLARTGNKFTFSSAVFGESYKSVRHDLALGDEAHVGLFTCSHEAGVVEQAVFSNVRVIIPAGGQGSMNTPGWSPDSKRIAFVTNSKL